MRLNEIIAAERSIRPLLTTCAEIKLLSGSVSQVAFSQVNQTAAALCCLLPSQLGFSAKRASCTEPVKVVVQQQTEKQNPPHYFIHPCDSGSLLKITILQSNAIGS